jgi:hypothetical protein
VWFNNLQEINIGKIEDLVKNKIEEDIFLEYKRDFNIDLPKDKKEFLCDLSQFANAKGGNIIYGIEEETDNKKQNTGKPKCITGFEIDNKDKLGLLLNNWITSLINPRIIGLEWRFIEFKNKFVLIFKIPASWIGPHIVTIDKSTLFYTRLGASKHQMDCHEIRSSFIQALKSENEVKLFRETRIAKIISDEAPVVLKKKPSIILHIYPLSSILSSNYIDLSLMPNKNNRYNENVSKFFDTDPASVPQNSCGNLIKKYNYEGFLICDQLDGEYSGYIQIYRNGIIEYLSFLSNDNDILNISLLYYYRINIDNIIKRFIDGLKILKVYPPFITMFCLINIKNSKIQLPNLINNGYDTSLDNSKIEPFNREYILLPDTLVENLTNETFEIIDSTFSILWNSVGLNDEPEFIKEELNKRRK